MKFGSVFGRPCVRRRTTVAAGAAASLVVVAGVLVVAPAAQAATFGGFEIAFTAPDSREWQIAPNGAPHETPSALAPNTSPSLVGLADGSYQESFVASDGTLWIDNSVTGGQQFNPCHDLTAYGVNAGSSPAITAITGGGWHVAFTDAAVGSDPGHGITEVGTDLLARDVCSEFSAVYGIGTSPDIATLPTGGFVKTYVAASDGLVRVSDSNGTRLAGNGLGVSPGTSPVIATNSSGWEIAFQGGDNHLWTVDSTGRQVQTPNVLEPTSGVGIAALSTGGYEIVFKAANNGLLREMAPDGTVRLAANGLGMAAHTSPAIAANNTGGFEIAFHAAEGGGNLDHVWTIDPSNTGHDTGQPIWANTSPDIAALITPTAPPTTAPPTTTPPQTIQVSLARQVPTSGPIWYQGQFPPFGSTQPGHLLQIQLTSGLLNPVDALLFVKTGHSTQECNSNPAATVQLNAGQTTTPAQIAAIYGTAQPTVDTLHPLPFVACYVGSASPGTLTIQATFQFN